MITDSPPQETAPPATDARPTLVLVDGSSYLYRAFHAMPDLRAVPGDPASAPTGAIRGMINMLQSLRREQPARYAACVFDASGPTFRDALYADYKAHRAPMPDDLRVQIEPIHEVVRLLGWPVLVVPGVEADDVIGTLAKAAAAQGLRVVISSGDKDLSQLVDRNITIVDTMSGKVRDEAGVAAEFGVPPALMLDWQTLVGDSVDNVPGVDKVGPRTAAKWLAQYGSLAGVIEHAAEIRGAAGDNLRRALDWLPRARELLAIRSDCDLRGHVPGLPALDALALTEPRSDGLRDFYRRYGFRSLARSLDGPGAAADGAAADGVAQRPSAAASAEAFAAAGRGVAPASVPVAVDIVLDEAVLDRWIERLMHAPLAALDTETTSLDEMRARIVGVSVCVEAGRAAYIPLAHDYPGAPAQLPPALALEKLRPWLEDPARAKLGQHVKYDLHVFANHGIHVRGYAHDTLLQSYVLEVHRPHGLESLAERHLGRSGIRYEDLCGKGAHQIPFAQVDIERAAAYSGEDSEQTLAVHRVLWPRLQAEPRLREVYELEMRTTQTLLRMERHGVLIDAQLLAAQSHELGQRIVALEARAHALAGQPFNLGSPKQIGEIFFGKLGLPVIKKTATGAPSTV